MAGDNRLAHTPEGTGDSYSAECGKKLAVQDKVLNMFYLCGYEHTQTPSLEYLDIFSKDGRNVSDREMFKFFDRDNSTLALQPDMTLAVTRCVTKYSTDDTMPPRFCYLGRTFRNNSSYQGWLKGRAETGVELIGDDSADGDAETTVMVVDSLKAAGLRESQVELGQVIFYRSLLEEVGLNGDVEGELNRLIESKNDFGVEELLENQGIDSGLKQMFLKLPRLFDSLEQVMEVKKLTANPCAPTAIERLEQVHHILESYGLASYVTYDLSMFGKYHYYAGIIFKAYAYGTGDYIITSGRRDKLLVQFGKDTPAVEFVTVVDQPMAALSRQQIDIPVTLVSTMILYEASARNDAIRLSRYFGDRGLVVQSMKRRPGKKIEDYKAMITQRHMRNLLHLEREGLMATAMNVVNHSADEIPVSAYG